MAIITLDDMKKHLGITTDSDDDLISAKIDAAQAHIESMLGYVITTQFVTVPADLKDAVRQLAAHWFENREASIVGVSIAETPMGVWAIITERRLHAWE